MIYHDMEENSQKISKFSSGLNIIMRLDELWKATHRVSVQGQYKLWNIYLDRMWLELSRDLDKENPEDYKEKKRKFEEFETKIKEIGQIADEKKRGFQKMTEDEVENRDKHYKILMDKQEFIARLENELGKGTTFDDGDNDDFD